MAFPAVLLLALAALAGASAETIAAPDPALAAQAAEVQKQGQAVPAALEKALNDILDKRYAAGDAFEADEKKRSDYAANKAVVDGLLAKLAAPRAQLKAAYTAFVKQQRADADQLVQKYSALLKARLTAPFATQASTKEIVALRKEKVALLAKWEDAFVAIMAKTKAAVKQVFVAAAAATKDAKQRQVVRGVAERRLSLVVLSQNAAFTTLTTTQFSAVEAFASAASKVLHLIVVKGETASL